MSADPRDILEVLRDQRYVGNRVIFNRAADEIERLRNMLDNRNEFIAERGLWKELGQYLSEPRVAVTGGELGK